MSSSRKKPPAPSFSRNNPTPIYLQISDHLKTAIAAGHFPAGQKLPSIRALARSLDVNHLTLRQALRHLDTEGLISTEPSRGAFVVGQQKQQLQIALILPNLNEGSSQISSGTSTAATPETTIDIFHYSDDPARETLNFKRLLSERYDGAIIYPSLDPHSIRPLAKLILDGFPIVFIGRAPAGIPAWSVLADNAHGGYLATQHLIQRGATRIACEYSTLPGASDRFNGFLRAMGDHKLPVDFSLVHPYERADDNIEQQISAWLKHPAPPNGIVFANDFQALRGLRQITDAGLRVPRHIRIIGFDNLSICDIGIPTLSSIRQNYPAIGETALKLLQQQINLPREQRTQIRQLQIPVELVHRQSS